MNISKNNNDATKYLSDINRLESEIEKLEAEKSECMMKYNMLLAESYNALKLQYCVAGKTYVEFSPFRGYHSPLISCIKIHDVVNMSEKSSKVTGVSMQYRYDDGEVSFHSKPFSTSALEFIENYIGDDEIIEVTDDSKFENLLSKMALCNIDPKNHMEYKNIVV